MDPSLVVIVPPDLPTRAAILREALAGTNIRVIVDQRRGERRQVQQPVLVQRRRRERRGPARVVAYVYACPVLAVETSPTDAMRSVYGLGAPIGLEETGVPQN
jgi:hypothetical protein